MHKQGKTTSAESRFGKSNDTEEWLDTVWTRPIGYMWARLFQCLGVHPNTVTVLSMIIGAASAYFFMQPSYRIDGWHGLCMNITGILLLAWANFYDSADGQLARMTGKKTRLGRILDGASSDVWYIPIYTALLFRCYNHHDMEFAWLGIEDNDTNALIYGAVIFLAAAYSGLACHAGQCRVADYYRQIHLWFIKGEVGSELDTYEEQKRIYAETPWKGNLVWKFFLRTYVSYTKAQEAKTPEFQALRQRFRQQYGNDAASLPQELRNEFREKSLPLLKWTNILTFNTRAIALYTACLIDMPWLYLAFEIIVLSAICKHMRHSYENICRSLLRKN